MWQRGWVVCPWDSVSKCRTRKLPTMTARYHSPLPATESLVLITNPHALISTLWADLPLICDIFNTVKIKRCVWNETNIYCPWVPVGPSWWRSLQLWMAEEKLFLQSEMKSGSREARLNPKHKVWGREWSNQPLLKKVMQNHWFLSWRWELCCGFHWDSIKALFPSFKWDWI